MGELLNCEYLEQFKDGLNEGEGVGVEEFAREQISVTRAVRVESRPRLVLTKIVSVTELTRKVSSLSYLTFSLFHDNIPLELSCIIQLTNN